jgi:hypothetical protein
MNTLLYYREKMVRIRRILEPQKMATGQEEGRQHGMEKWISKGAPGGTSPPYGYHHSVAISISMS